MSETAVADRTSVGELTRRPRRRNSGQRLTRLLHSWLSMATLLVVLFFAVTGLLLHHQEWTFGIDPTTTQTSGELPSGSIVDGVPNYLDISEYLRTSHGASGSVSDYGTSGTTGRIAYTGPGYAASATFDVNTGSFTMTTTRYGLVSYFYDLHRGSNTSGVWGWVIDVAAVGLALIALTGVVLQLMIRKKRTTALVLLGVGVVAGVGLMFLA
jgi:uncharacterized protein